MVASHLDATQSQEVLTAADHDSGGNGAAKKAACASPDETSDSSGATPEASELVDGVLDSKLPLNPQTTTTTTTTLASSSHVVVSVDAIFDAVLDKADRAVEKARVAVETAAKKVVDAAAAARRLRVRAQRIEEEAQILAEVGEQVHAFVQSSSIC